MTDKKTGGKKLAGLLRSRSFLPLFAAMFLGAFNDNFFRSAMAMLITYRLADETGGDARVIVTLASGVFILPFVLFSAIAGQLADKYERAGIARCTKLAEIAVMAGAVAAFYSGSVRFLMTILFLMGAQSAFFGPIKYSILPQCLKADELVGANALIETGTFLSILLGTIAGGVFVMGEGGVSSVSFLVVFIAAAGWAASLFIPRTRVVRPSLKLRFGIFGETAALVKKVIARREAAFPIFGISWFYAVGGIFTSQFPGYAKTVLGADSNVATLMLAVFSFGIGAGSIACSHLLKGEISARYTPLAAVAISALSLLLAALSAWRPAESGDLLTIWRFLLSPLNSVILLCLFGISFFGGIYIVPLYAVMQNSSSERDLAGVTACSNVMDAFFMAASAAAAALLLAAGLRIPSIFSIMAVLNLAAAKLLRGGIKV
ncbi:hypothetical protein FACS1894167_10100 [Synergistales bacterium]|nr:hypothetical protein FACS1894167_10100 [Synergistales bacterium]